MRKLFLLFCLFPLLVAGQQSLPVAVAVRTNDAPRIDGKLDDVCWNTAKVIDRFTQYEPDFKNEPRQKTKVRILYDDGAVYIGAMMYDSAPDSILHQLGTRDDELNADKLVITFDTYYLQTDAYTFKVYASGVQCDYRLSDDTYNAVWQSSVKINDSGWVAEIKIPYSAFRFPNTSEQVWGMEINRGIRRYRELDQWALIEKGVANELLSYGKLNGISDIKAPLRLSVTPYISLYGEHYPYDVTGKSNYSGAYGGGLDLKWGIDESFTVDMTLLPDFSQVQSDNLVKNISAFETEYNENRPFFNEGIDLFEKGNLFYSRRIGREPAGYESMEDSLNAGEYIFKNPGQAKLLNATKLSGRGKKGTGIGIFNAITDNMYAVIEDSLGNKRKILTEPLTNYNIVVFDQVLKNNSDVYLVNTNVTRDKGRDDANVTAGGLTLNDKKNIWQFNVESALSQKFHRNTSDPTDVFENSLGYRYLLSFGKVEGNFNFLVSREHLSKGFDINDIGLIYQNNETRHQAAFVYRTFEPLGLVRSSNTELVIFHRVNAETQKLSGFEFEMSNFITFTNYFTIWEGAGYSPLHTWDYYEPRLPGRVYLGEPYYFAYFGFSSDYRKAFALDGQCTWISTVNHPYRAIESFLTPIVRASDRLFFTYTIAYNQGTNDEGFATVDTGGNVIFGNRTIREVENGLEARFIFINDLSLSLRARHYWSMGKYNYFYSLQENGKLEHKPDYDGSGDYNFNYNAFNIDLTFSWQFAPGSKLSIVYKMAILEDENRVIPDYWDNLSHTFKSDQLNSLSIKALYYLDYQYLRKRSRKN